MIQRRLAYRGEIYRGPSSDRERRASQEAFEEANRLIKEGYQFIEIRTPDGLVLLQDDLSTLIEEQKKNKPGRR